MADYRRFLSFGCMQLYRESRERTCCAGWLDDMERSFHAFVLLKECLESPEWTFSRNKTQRRGVQSQQFEMQRYFCTIYGIEEALEQGSERSSARRREAILYALLGHNLACLQMCWHHSNPRKL